MAKNIPSIMRRRLETRGLTREASSHGIGFLGAPTISGLTITPQVALTFSAVFSAINVISRDFAGLPPIVSRRLKTGGSRPDPTFPLHRLLNREPNPGQPRSTAIRFRQSLIAHALGWGSGFAEILRDSGGYPIGFDLLHPSTTHARETEDGRLYYETPRKNLAPENVFHLAGLSFDGVSGYSPVGMAREAIGLGKAAEQFGASLFGNGAVPKGVLKTGKKLSETAVKNLRDGFNRVHQGSARANSIAILEDGIEWVNTQINPEDAQFLATRAFQVVEIARIFSIPPHKIGDYSQSHLANVEASNLDYLTTTLAGWIEAFEAEANLKLISERDSSKFFVACDMTQLMRGDTIARVTYYKGMRDLGAMNADEIRLRENLNPIGPEMGGEKYLVQMNLMTLEEAGETPAETAAEVEPEPEPMPTPMIDPISEIKL